jgi:hypothetical protein
MQTHLTLRPLKSFEEPDKFVHALFAVNPNRKAIVFIHGFSGDAIATWSDFHLLLPECVHCAGRDIYFYGYDGLWTDIYANAGLFRGFVGRLFTKTSRMVNDNLPPLSQRVIGFGYDEILIAAHSLGAVIVRRSLLDATTEGAEWAPKVKMVLYAPAHKGARVVNLALSAANLPFLDKFVEPAAALARFKSPLIDQLTRGSEALKQLLDDTEKARQNGANAHLRARKVIMAKTELIVEQDRFADDPPPVPIPDTDHVSVCKPRHNFRHALTHLEECL